MPIEFLVSGGGWGVGSFCWKRGGVEVPILFLWAWGFFGKKTFEDPSLECTLVCPPEYTCDHFHVNSRCQLDTYPLQQRLTTAKNKPKKPSKPPNAAQQASAEEVAATSKISF